MVNFLETDAKHVVGIRIEGKVEEQEFDAVAALLEKRMQEFPKVNVYVELESFTGMEVRALLKDLKFGLKNLDRFDKEAIVTDKKWVQKIAGASDSLVKDVQVKAFDKNEKDLARKWIHE
jgi:hypothetical protein